MLLCGINDNVIISHPSYLGVYQYEAKMGALQRDRYFLGWYQTKKTDKTVVHVTDEIINIW